MVYKTNLFKKKHVFNKKIAVYVIVFSFVSTSFFPAISSNKIILIKNNNTNTNEDYKIPELKNRHTGNYIQILKNFEEMISKFKKHFLDRFHENSNAEYTKEDDYTSEGSFSGLCHPNWPSNWIKIDTDPNEDGSKDDYRDVQFCYYNFDDNYLYLRQQCYGYPHLDTSRYKWFIDLDCNAYLSGGNIIEGEYLLFLEDTNDV